MRQHWLDRCALPLRVGEVCAIWPGEEPGQSATLVLDGAPPVRIAQDLATLAMMKIQIGDLVCLRLDGDTAVVVDFVDGQLSLMSTRLPLAAQRAPQTFVG